MGDEARARFSPRLLGILLATTVFFAVLAIYALHDTRFDDAYITFRYGQNLATGRGPVFNPGERILGTTSPGEMLVSAAVYLLAGLDGTPAWMAALGCVAWIAQAFFIFIVLRKAFGDWTALLGAAALMLGAAGSDIRVALETNQVVAFNMAALWMAMEKRWRTSALLAGLGVLFRPDALVFALPLAFLCALEQRRKALVPALIFLGAFTPWLLFATHFYGTPIPLTAATKFQRAGVAMYAQHIYDHLGIYVRPGRPMLRVLIWALGIGGAVRLCRENRWYALLAAYPFLHYAAYLKLRPFTAHTWHLYPAEAMMIVLAMVALGRMLEGVQRWGRWLGAAVAAFVLLSTSFYTVARIATHQDSQWTGGRDRAYREVAAFLEANGDRDREYFASVEVGTIAYLTDFRAMDLGWLVSAPGEMLEEGELRWLVVDPLYHYLVPAGAPLVFVSESGRFRAEIYDLWKGNTDPNALERIRGADWAF
jgi:hypothetical protein